VRVGPWADPNSPAAEAPTSVDANYKRGLGARLAGLFGSLNRRAQPEPVEAKVYRSEACPIDDPLVDRLTELVRLAQSAAVDRAWPRDGGVLANHRREGEEARAAGDLRGALRCLGESIVLLGLAGRLHRKAHGPAPVT